MDPAVLSAVAKVGGEFAARRATQGLLASALTGAYVASAAQTIEQCALETGERSAIWTEVCELLGNESAAEQVIWGPGLQTVSTGARPWVVSFLELFKTMLRALVPAQDRPFADTILSAIKIGNAEITERVETLADLVKQIAPAPDPNADVPWSELPGAPQLECQLHVEASTGRLHGTVIVTAEPAIVLTLAVGKAGTTAAVKLMRENSSKPPRMVYSFSGGVVELEGDAGSVEAVARFVWRGHHTATWVEPVTRHRKGHLVVEGHLGTPHDVPELS